MHGAGLREMLVVAGVAGAGVLLAALVALTPWPNDGVDRPGIRTPDSAQLSPVPVEAP